MKNEMTKQQKSNVKVYYETSAFADDLDVFVNTEYKNAVLEQK
jgi:hypothetical protein